MTRNKFNCSFYLELHVNKRIITLLTAAYLISVYAALDKLSLDIRSNELM